MISKYINGGAFAFILICFVLPFVSIKCNTMKLAELKGYDLIVGKAIDAENSPMMKGMKELGNNMWGENADTNMGAASGGGKDTKIMTNWFMVLVLLCAITGVVLSFVSKNKKGLAAIVPAAIALVALLTFVVVMNYQLQSRAGANTAGLFEIKIKLGYEIGFWLMLLLLLFIIVYNVYTNNRQTKANKISQAEPFIEPPKQSLDAD